MIRIIILTSAPENEDFMGVRRLAGGGWTGWGCSVSSATEIVLDSYKNLYYYELSKVSIAN